MRKSRLLALALIFLSGTILTATMANATPPQVLNYFDHAGEIPYVPGELIITLKESNNMAIAENNDFHSRMMEAIPNFENSVKWESVPLHASLIKVKEGEEIAQITTLKQNPNIESVELNSINYARGVVSTDPNFSLQWHLNSVNAPKAWNFTTGSPNIIVAVIDTGIDYNHSDLISGIWNNTSDSCTDGVDNDSNGKIDDCRGWDFVNNDNNPIDDSGHGTFVSGIIGARLNNIFGASMAPNISLMPIKALNSGGVGNTGNLTAAITYAVNNGADVINMSLGAYGTCSPVMQNAVNYANANGVVVVVAAGEGFPRQIDKADKWPLCDHVISVTSTDNFNNSAHYSDEVNTNDLAAPGGDQTPGGHLGSLPIFSTLIGNTFSTAIGTSFAAPHVSGCAALMKTLNSTLGADLIQSKMEISALDLTDSGYILNNATVGKDKVFGWGLIKCDAALIAALDANSPTFTIQYYADSNLTTSLGDNPKLKAGTYYLKITSNESLSGAPTVSIDAQGTANDVTNVGTSPVSGNDYKYTQTIAPDAAATGTTLEDISITGTDTAANTSTSVNPTNEIIKAAFTDTVPPSITQVIPASSSSVNQFNMAYTLSENVASGIINFTGTSATDLGVVHTYNFAAGDKTSGPHAISKTTLFGSSLVNGAVYTMTVSATDYLSNVSTVSNTSITYNVPPGICSVPLSGDWVISSGCRITSISHPLGNVDIQNGAIVTIESGGTLNIDSLTHFLKIHFGSGILIKSGGKIA
jgi:subtilisin family serine protease